MARSNRTKYNRLDYVLMGKPGKRRWHKRQHLAPEKRVESGIAALNSGAALTNRNRRERELFRRSLRESDPSKKRRGLVRAISYGLLMGGAVALTLWGIATNQKVNNLRAFKEGAKELSSLFEKRAAHLTEVVSKQGQVGQTIRNAEQVTISADARNKAAAAGLIDDDEETLKAAAQFSRTRHRKAVSSKHGLIELARGEIMPGSKKSIAIDGLEAEFERRAPLLRDVDWAHNLIEKVSQIDDKIAAVADDMRSLIKRRGKGKDFNDDIEKALDYVRSTNLKKITSDPRAVQMILDRNPTFLQGITQTAGGKFVFGKGANAVEVTPDEILERFLATDRGIDISGKISIGADESRQIVKGLRDDLIGALQFRKRRAGNILRTGKAEPEGVRGSRVDLGNLRAKATNKADAFGSEDTTTDYKFVGKKTMAEPEGFTENNKYTSTVAEVLGDNKNKRKTPLLDPSLSKKEKTGRVFRAIGEILRPNIKSAEGLRTAGVGLMATGAALGAAHMGGGLASNASRSINDSWDRRDRENRLMYTESMLRERRRRLSETGRRDISQASIRHSLERARATEAESPTETYIISDPLMNSLNMRIQSGKMYGRQSKGR